MNTVTRGQMGSNNLRIYELLLGRDMEVIVARLKPYTRPQK